MWVLIQLSGLLFLAGAISTGGSNTLDPRPSEKEETVHPDSGAVLDDGARPADALADCEYALQSKPFLLFP